MKTFKPDEPIVIRPADVFELVLPVVATAGYEWQVAELTPGLVHLGVSFHAPPERRLGGTTQQALRFQAERPGRYQARLICKRSWDATPSETLTIPITVGGS
jgi:predicted secreted protein